MATKTRTSVWRLRKKLGLTQQDIVDRAGVCLRTYRDIEHLSLIHI